MDINELEKNIVDNGKNIATIKAKLFNGLTADVSEIKLLCLGLSKDFQTYKDTRPEKCYYRIALKEGKVERREGGRDRRGRLAIIIAVGAFLLNGLGLVLTKVL